MAGAAGKPIARSFTKPSAVTVAPSANVVLLPEASSVTFVRRSSSSGSPRQAGKPLRVKAQLLLCDLRF